MELMMGHAIDDVPLDDGMTVVDLEGFRVGDVVRMTGYDGEFQIDAILPEAVGERLHEPFRLRSVRRDETEGYSTAYGTITPAIEESRHIWLWAAASDLVVQPNDDTPALPAP